MSSSVISKRVIKRLPRYYRYLSELLADGVDRISSGELGRKMHVTASQIRQDLNNFGGFGQQGYGYNVQYLYNEIGHILNLEIEKNIIVIGAGNFGKALSNSHGFKTHGFNIIAIFDNNPNKVDRKAKIPIFPMDELEDFVKNNQVSIATITVPESAAVEVAQRVVNNNIKAIWNFALVDLESYVPDDIVVMNEHLSESLMRISYNLNVSERQGKI